MDMKRDSVFVSGVALLQDAKSPFWVAQWSLSDGSRKKRSTKVPVAGGLFQGERLSAAQAKKRAMLVAHELAERMAEEVQAERLVSVRVLLDTVLKGKLGRLSVSTYDNARTTYAQFCDWLGKRAHEPARAVTRADIKPWVTDRRSVVRCKTVKHNLYVLRAAFNWAVDAELLDKNPCDKVQVLPDGKDEKVVHEAFSQEEIRLLVEKLPVIDHFGQRGGLYDGVALVDAHVTGCDLIDEHDLAVVIAELKLDIPQVKTDGLEVVGNDLGDRQGLCLEGFEHLSGHNAKRNQTLAGY